MQRNGNQLQEHTRGNNVNGSISHHNTHNRMNDSCQHRDENKGKTGSYSHLRKDGGLQHGDDNRGYSKIFSHRSTFRNRDDYTRRDDKKGLYRSIHRDTYTGNRDAQRNMDKNRERDEVDYWRESDVYTDNRDNDRFQYKFRDDLDGRRYSDSYYTGDSVSECEKMYNDKRHSDRFEYEY